MKINIIDTNSENHLIKSVFHENEINKFYNNIMDSFNIKEYFNNFQKIIDGYNNTTEYLKYLNNKNDLLKKFSFTDIEINILLFYCFYVPCFLLDTDRFIIFKKYSNIYLYEEKNDIDSVNNLVNNIRELKKCPEYLNHIFFNDLKNFIKEYDSYININEFKKALNKLTFDFNFNNDIYILSGLFISINEFKDTLTSFKNTDEIKIMIQDFSYKYFLNIIETQKICLKGNMKQYLFDYPLEYKYNINVFMFNTLEYKLITKLSKNYSLFIIKLIRFYKQNKKYLSPFINSEIRAHIEKYNINDNLYYCYNKIATRKDDKKIIIKFIINYLIKEINKGVDVCEYYNISKQNLSKILLLNL